VFVDKVMDEKKGIKIQSPDLMGLYGIPMTCVEVFFEIGGVCPA